VLNKASGQATRYHYWRPALPLDRGRTKCAIF